MEFFSDLKYSIRSFARRPLFTGVLVLTLALGIGSNVAIFSVADAVLFSPLPYENPEELALIWTELPATGGERTLVSGPEFSDYRTESRLFDEFAGAFAIAGTLTGEGPAERLMVGWATQNLFGLLGIPVLIGRDFNDDDAFPIDPAMMSDPNAELPPGAVLLSHGLWQRRFGGDPSVVGTTVQMDGWGSVIVGVLPPDFRIYLPADAGMPTDIDAWRVTPSNFSDVSREAPWLTVVGRLRPGVTLEAARSEMDALAMRLREQHQFHANSNMQIVVNGMHEDVVAHARPALLSLLGAVAFVLLIACGNVANLLLVRASTREREIAVRAAMGGGRGRIIRQMITESAVLAIAGAVLGLAMAWGGIRVVVALSPANLPRLDTVGIDATVLLFTAAVTAVAAVIFGLAPALRAVSGNLADVLKDRGADAGGLKGNKLRTTLVVTEVALSAVLLIGAGLMIRSFSALRNVDPGFTAENIMTFEAPLPFLDYVLPQPRADFANQFGRRLRDIPGVESVGGVTPLPLSGGDQYSVGGYGLVGGTDEAYSANRADYKAVLPGYLETMEIEIVAGRALEPFDNEGEALPVIVVDETLAERVWGDEDPVGTELVIDRFNEQTFELERRTTQVVGVAANVRSQSLASNGRATIYMPYKLNPWLSIVYTVRTTAEPDGLLPLIRAELEAMDPAVPVATVELMETYMTRAMAQNRFMLLLVSVFALMALILASLGLYGVISYSVRQRTREIGVRVAFGAGDDDVLKLVLRSGLTVALAGIVIGLGAAFALTRVVKSMLVGVNTTDPSTFVGIPVLLLTVAIVASYLPARRATRIDPIEALRDE